MRFRFLLPRHIDEIERIIWLEFLREIRTVNLTKNSAVFCQNSGGIASQSSLIDKNRSFESAANEKFLYFYKSFFETDKCVKDFNNREIVSSRIYDSLNAKCPEK